MDIRFIFQYEKELVQLPNNPPNFSDVFVADNQTTNIIALGEVNTLGHRKLREMPISSYLPNYPDSRTETTGKFQKPDFYIKFFEKVINDRKPVRLIVTGLNINVLVSIESFEYQRYTDYVDYTLTLKEYRNFSAKEVKIVQKPSTGSGDKTTAVQKKPSSRQKSGFAVGDVVICNGNFYHDSYKSSPYGTFRKDYEGKISIIVSKPQSGQTHPIHITTLGGGWLGWVQSSQIRHK